MANELGPIPYATGQTLKAALFNAAGQVRDVVAGAWVSPGAATLADCLIALAESGASGVYSGDLTAGLDAGNEYTLAVYLGTPSGFGDMEALLATATVGPGVDAALTAIADVQAEVETLGPGVGAATLSYTVYYPDGTTPFEGALVLVWAKGNTARTGQPIRQATSGSDGKVTFYVSTPGDYPLTVIASGYPTLLDTETAV